MVSLKALALEAAGATVVAVTVGGALPWPPSGPGPVVPPDPYPNNKPWQRPTRRRLRSHGTPAEAALWRRLQRRQVGGLEFRRQFGVGPCVLDFCCPRARLAVEVDGAVHNDPVQAAYDAERTRHLAAVGIRVLRFENRLVFEHGEEEAALILRAALEGGHRDRGGVAGVACVAVPARIGGGRRAGPPPTSAPTRIRPDVGGSEGPGGPRRGGRRTARPTPALRMRPFAPLVALAALTFAAGCSGGTEVLRAPEPPPSTEPAFDPLTEAELAGSEAATFDVPVVYDTLANGLKVVVSEDHTSPTAVVAVYYNVGFRIEPRDRTGFAHLFEHMMFQGSEHLGKNEFIGLVQRNGGVLNGSTRFDFTNYFEIVPSNTVETMLWAEADRMRGLDITQDNLTNQQGVVSNEVRVNVINQPYGGFPWLDLPQAANENWYNAHNFYGELSDLEAATLDDVQAFFDTYYAPNNAVVVVVGDVDPGEVMGWVEEYFGQIPRAQVPPTPDLREPRQTEAKRVAKVDSLATRPAVAFAYHMPPRNSDAYFAMGLLQQILLEGDDSRLHQELVTNSGLTASVNGGINWPLGNMYNYNGPMLWSGWLIHDAETPVGTILAVIEKELATIRERGVEPDVLARAKVKVRSDLYDTVGGTFGFGRADLLASFALFDDDPARINALVERFERVTPGLIRRTAQEVFRPENRTVITLEAAGGGS